MNLERERYIYMHIHVYKYCYYKNVYVCIYLCIQYICMCARVCVCVYMYIHIRTCIFIRIHVYIHININKYIPLLSVLAMRSGMYSASEPDGHRNTSVPAGRLYSVFMLNRTPSMISPTLTCNIHIVSPNQHCAGAEERPTRR